MTTPTTAGGAVLPVVGYRLNSGHGNHLRETLDDATKSYVWAGKPAWRELTYLDTAQAEIDALRAELAELKAAQDDQARDARRLDWLDNTPHSGIRIDYEGERVGFHITSWDDQSLGIGKTIRDAIDDARGALANPLQGKETPR